MINLMFHLTSKQLNKHISIPKQPILICVKIHIFIWYRVVPIVEQYEFNMPQATYEMQFAPMEMPVVPPTKPKSKEKEKPKGGPMTAR